MSVCFIKQKMNNLRAYSHQTITSKVWKCHTNRESVVERIIKKNKVTNRVISFCPTSNKTPLSPPYRFGSKRKLVPEEKYND